MGLIADLFAGRVPLIGIDTKAYADTVRVGVQGRPQYPDTDIDSLFKHYKRNELVYACIDAKARAAIDPRLLVQRRSSGTEWAEAEGHPLRRLLMRPNPQMDESAFTKWGIVSTDVAGVFYAEIVRQGKNGPPIQLWPLNPRKIAPIPRASTEDGAGIDYEFKDGTTKVIIPGENMLAWRKFDITSRWHGLSPLAVCLASVDADSAQTDYARDFFNNGGMPGGILTIKGRTISETEANALKARWTSRFGRHWGRQHDIAIFDENAAYQKLGANLDELDSESLRGFTESRICMVFGVPPQIIGAKVGLDHATYSNYREAQAAFWDNTLTPWFKDWRTFLMWRLLPEFESEDLIMGERVRLNWDMSQVAALQEDVNEAEARARENVKAGLWLVNEGRAATGKPPDPNGDYYLRPIMLTAVRPDEAVEAPPTTETRSLALRREVKALSARSRRVLERSVERVMGPYLRREYGKAVEAA